MEETRELAGKERYVNKDGVVFVRSLNRPDVITDIIVPDGVKELCATFGAEHGVIDMEGPLGWQSVVHAIDIRNNGRTYPNIESIRLNKVNVLAKNEQFKNVKSVSYGIAVFTSGDWDTPILFSDIDNLVVGNFFLNEKKHTAYIGDGVFSIADCKKPFFTDKKLVVAKDALRGLSSLSEIDSTYGLPFGRIDFMPGAFNECGIKKDEKGLFICYEKNGRVLLDFDEEMYVGDDGLVSLALPEEITNISYTVVRKADRLTFTNDVAFKNALCALKTAKEAGELPRVYVSGEHMDEAVIVPPPGLCGYVGKSAGLLAKDGVLFSGDGKELLSFPPGMRLASYRVPDGTEKIGEKAFSGAEIGKVILPDSVKTLLPGAFSNSFIDEVVLSSSIRMLGSYAAYPETLDSLQNSSPFAYSAIKRVVIPSSLKIIGKMAFFGCMNLRDVVFEEGGTYEIGDYAFVSSPISSVCLPKSCMKVGNYAFYFPEKVAMYQETVISDVSFAGLLWEGRVSDGGIDEERNKRLCIPKESPFRQKNAMSVLIFTDRQTGEEMYSPFINQAASLSEFSRRWSLGKITPEYLAGYFTGYANDAYAGTFGLTVPRKTVCAMQALRFGNDETKKKAEKYIRKNGGKTALLMLSGDADDSFLLPLIKTGLLPGKEIGKIIEKAAEFGKPEIAAVASEYMPKEKTLEI